MFLETQNYKYRLRRGSRKEVCPSCRRKTFVPYVDDSGLMLDPSVGKCDRKDKCAYHRPPREYFANQSPLTNPQSTFNPISPDFIDPELMRQTLTGRSPLHTFLSNAIPGASPELVAEELRRYAVGEARLFGGACIFWQIDAQGHVRTGKIMGYDPATGRRIKNPRPLMAWAHTRLPNPHPDFRLQQCFFGTHLLRLKPKARVWLMESEKAAIITSIFVRSRGVEDVVVLATGGSEGFNPSPEAMRDPFDKHYPLRSRHITLLPDCGMTDAWRSKAYPMPEYEGGAAVLSVTTLDAEDFADLAGGLPGAALDDLILMPSPPPLDWDVLLHHDPYA